MGIAGSAYRPDRSGTGSIQDDACLADNRDFPPQGSFRKPSAGAATIYREKVSGVRADRPQLAKLIASLGKGDVILVTKLDRVGRSTRELLDLIHGIDEAEASFKAERSNAHLPSRPAKHFPVRRPKDRIQN